ncbi:unnamed protein product [Spirodela intermedia]|uniref:AP2/ERF domain-containing protein n=1 Tax=Spirodela intermedia TaxID=51605 RepID=A0A7I8JSH5_SPIIN|nr:unnamed protein product [Spirodela intermedia]CAA6673157.1 unnamed protein product [Spirodela intermedia]
MPGLRQALLIQGKPIFKRAPPAVFSGEEKQPSGGRRRLLRRETPPLLVGARKIRVLCCDPDATDDSSGDEDDDEVAAPPLSAAGSRKKLLISEIHMFPSRSRKKLPKAEAPSPPSTGGVAAAVPRYRGIRDPIKGARVWLGTYDTAEQAAMAYQRAADRINAERSLSSSSSSSAVATGGAAVDSGDSDAPPPPPSVSELVVPMLAAEELLGSPLGLELDLVDPFLLGEFGSGQEDDFVVGLGHVDDLDFDAFDPASLDWVDV